MPATPGAGLAKAGTVVATRTPEQIDAAMQVGGMDNTAQMGPGRPLTPYQGYSQPPRVTDYPVGVNISTSTRQSWGRMSFDTLGALVDAYDVARMCINHKIDELRSMEPMFVPIDGRDGARPNMDGSIDAARAALEFPDRELPYLDWLSKLLENALRYDATPLYHRRNFGGDVIGLEVVDGTTIAPYVDDHGRRPRPPAPAYYQLIHGQPWNWYTTDDIEYNRFRPQNDPYGLAPMEQLLLTANTDMRFQWHFLQMFTDGSMPGGFIELPPDVSSPDQVAEWQDYWDAMILGDQAKLHQLIAVPNGTKIQTGRPDAFDSAFPEYLMSRTCAAFGVTPQDLGLIKDVNRANGETQVDIQFRVNTLPWVRWVEGILSRYLRYQLGLPVRVNLDTGRDKEDRLAEAQAWKIAVEGGAASVDEWRSEIYGLPIDNERPMPRFIFSPRTGPVPLASVLALAGPVDPETGAPVNGVPLSSVPFDGAPGLLPDKSPGGTQFKRAPINPDEPEFPQLEKPIPGSDVVGTRPGAPVIGDPGVTEDEKVKQQQQAAVAKEATAGVTSGTGIVGSPLADTELIVLPDGDGEDEPVEKAADAERAAFARFTRARARAGRWRDFTFEHVPAVDAHRLNDQGRAQVRKAAGELVAAGLAVVAADTGRVLLLQRGLDPTDPNAGLWEFPGGHIEDGEDPIDAARREWQEETGCLLPSGQVTSGWLSDDGVYEGFVYTVASETVLPIFTRGQVNNPDDPDGDGVEAVAWWTPSLLPGNPAIRPELAASLPDVLAALPDTVAKAGGVDPKGSWRDSADKVPQHRFDLALTDHYSPKITAALRAAFPEALLRSAITAAQSQVVKAVDPATAALRAQVKAALAAGASGSQLEQVLRDAVHEGYAAGAFSAGEQLPGGRVLPGVAEIDWATWQPGSPEAAGLLENGGLARLLDRTGSSVDGITGTLLDQLGNTIADGVGRGDSIGTIAGSLGGIIDDPGRAEMIAHTEMARAISQATADTYADNGVTQWDWLLSDDACEECQEQADDSPHDAGDDPPPLHPYCRCAMSPVADSIDAAASPGDGSGDSGGGLLDDALDADMLLDGGGDSLALDDAGAAGDLSSASDDDLSGMLAGTTDEAQIDRILTELERRDQAEAAARADAERKAAAKAARDAKAASARAELDRKYDEALAAGEDPIEAYARVYGKDVERVRIDAAMGELRAAGYTGRNYEELCQSQLKEYAERAWLQAEGDTRGALLNAAGRKAGIDARSLFLGQESRARKYASEELLGFWQRYGRLTLDDFKAANLGRKGRAAGTDYFL